MECTVSQHQAFKIISLADGQYAVIVYQGSELSGSRLLLARELLERGVRLGVLHRLAGLEVLGGLLGGHQAGLLRRQLLGGESLLGRLGLLLGGDGEGRAGGQRRA